jgi:hypothetical protein
MIKKDHHFRSINMMHQVLLALGVSVPDASGCDCTDYCVTHATGCQGDGARVHAHNVSLIY